MIAARASAARWAGLVGCAAALTALMLWPLVHGGYLLGHDMVFTPRQPLDLASIGVGSASPRAVPLDALVALAERIVNGAVVGRLALVLPLLAAGAGSALLLRTRSWPAQLATLAVAVWNPFVVERLALGQWALLWAYAALPWLVVAIERGRGRTGWLGRGLALAAASITPTGGLIAAMAAIALVVGLRRPKGEVLATGALAVVFQLPWLVPSLASTAAATSDPGAVAAFSARAEAHLGTILSLLTGGGIWDSEVMPRSRGGVLPWVWLVVVIAAAGYGAGRLIALLGRRVVLILTALAGAGFLLAVLPALPGGGAILRAAVAHVPGAGLLRDSQKWALPLVLLEALLIGAAVARLVDRCRGPARAVLALAAVVVPIIVLPDAAATVRPTVDPVRYPADWQTVSRLIGPGDTAVLPWGSYRSFPWAPGRSVLDPAPRLLPSPTVVDDRLAVSGRLLAGEDERARAVGRALRDSGDLPGELARLGIRWVVVERDTPGTTPDLSGLIVSYRGSAVSLYAVPGRIANVTPTTGRVVAVVSADVLAVLSLLVLLGWAGAGAMRAGRHGGRREPGGRGHGD